MDLHEEIGYLRARVDDHTDRLGSIERKMDTLLTEFHQRKGATRILLLLASVLSALVSWVVALWVPRG